MLSFIVPAHNEARRIAETLRAIRAAAEPLGEPWEMVVADDASTDGTAAIAEAEGARVVRVEYRKISAVRNAGARAAAGEFFFFIDADTRLSPEVLRRAFEALRAGAVGGGARIRFDGRLPAYAHALTLALNLFSHAAGLAYGCFLFCSRAAFEAAGGFDETLYGAEEWNLSRKLRRQGPFRMLREKVITSGRKLRAFSGWETFRMFAVLSRPGALRRRSSMPAWYEARREDPG